MLCKRVPAVSLDEEATPARDECLPFFSWIPNLHASPFFSRFHSQQTFYFRLLSLAAVYRLPALINRLLH